MVKCEFYKRREDGVILVKTTSDKGFYLKQAQTGNLLKDPIDVGEKYLDEVNIEILYRPKFYSYTETDIEIKE